MCNSTIFCTFVKTPLQLKATVNMKSYEQKSWSLPQPILIIGTYDKKQKAITHANGKRLKQPVAQVFNIIVDYADEIKAQLTHPSTEMLMLIKDFNPILLNYTPVRDNK